MRIEVVPPTEPTYVLHLTRDELVTLGRLSYQCERGVGKRFHELLPKDIRALVETYGGKEPGYRDEGWNEGRV